MPESKERIINTEDTQQSGESVKTTPEIVDLKKDVPVSREVKTWMQKLEENPALTQKAGRNQTNDDLLLKPIVTNSVKINLPTDKTTFTGGFAKPVDQAWRWLSEFVLRIIKKNQGNVKFKEE